MAAWFRPTLTADDQARVLADRDEYPDPVVRRKMLVLWAVHLGHSRQQAAGLAAVGLATAKRYLIAFRDGGLDALGGRRPSPRPTSQLAAHADAVKQSLDEQPVRTTAEAIDRIEPLTGLRRGLTQTRTFLAGLGFTWQRTRAVPVPPKSR
jgi:transposase